jgi:hypothetical protein
VRSSNSSAPDPGPFGYLERCLDALEAEVPVAHGLVVRALTGRAVAIDIEGDRVTLAMASGRHCLTRGVDAGCAVELALTEAVIGRLLDARCTVLDAVLGGEVVLRGAAEDLAALHDALLAFVHGAIRSPTAPRLLESYRDRAAPSKGWTRTPDASHGERHDLSQR